MISCSSWRGMVSWRGRGRGRSIVCLSMSCCQVSATKGLSPVTIARFIDAQVHRSMASLLDSQQLDAFWRCIPGQPTTIDELAPAIGAILDDALRSPTRDPRGPLALVPAALRVVIRMFVRHEAFRSTQALRVYEASGTAYRRASRERGPWPESAPG